MSDVPVPRWAASARGIFRSLVAVWVVLWVIRGVFAVADRLFDIGTWAGDMPESLRPVAVALLGVWLVSGVVWLAGAVVTGYRAPNR